MKYTLYLFVISLLFAACQSNHKEHATIVGIEIPIHYAKGFEMKQFDTHTLLSIRNPWDTTGYLQHYVLIDRNVQLPSPLPAGTLIRTPLQRVVAFDTPQCGIFQELNRLSTLVGVCESRFIKLPYVTEGVKNGSIIDLGESSAPNVEQLIELDPEAVFTTPFQNVGYGRLAKSGIPLIECADYMEQSPLGRAEWIRFHGALFGHSKLADSLFNETVKAYKAIQILTADITHRPTLLTETKTGATWYVPGGESYMAKLYKDAGAHYLWEDTKSTGSLPLSTEEVIDKAEHADFWIIKYSSDTPLTYRQLKKDFELNTRFKAWQQQTIFAVNAGRVSFYEEAPLHPDRILKDLVWVFHPELLPEYQPQYFEKVAE